VTQGNPMSKLSSKALTCLFVIQNRTVNKIVIEDNIDDTQKLQLFMSVHIYKSNSNTKTHFKCR
jgi:hypothetical protein